MSGKQVQKKRHVATAPLVSDANTSVRTARRVQFPPLQFVHEGVRTPTKTYATRSHISESVQSFVTENHTRMACLQSSCDNEVCLEHVEKEVQTVEDMQATNQYMMTNTAAYCGCLAITDKVISSTSDELTSCPLEPFCCNIDDETANNNCLPVGISDSYDKDVTLAEKSSHLSHKQDLTVCAANTSDVHFDINTPSCEFEPSDFTEGQHIPANEVAAEAHICQNMSSLADHNSVEPLHVLSFSRLDRSLDATEDPVKVAICAAELNEDMSGLPEKYDEPSINEGKLSFFLDKREFFSAPNSLTSLENRKNYTVLVSDTPVSDYGLSYRQRAIKAGNVRLQHQTRKS